MRWRARGRVSPRSPAVDTPERSGGAPERAFRVRLGRPLLGGEMGNSSWGSRRLSEPHLSARDAARLMRAGWKRTPEGWRLELATDVQRTAALQRIRTPASQPSRNARIIAAAVVCLYCDATLTPSNPGSIDHMVPRALGGVNAWWNLAVSCHPCNTRKRDLPFPRWIEVLRSPHRERAQRFYQAQLIALSDVGPRPPDPPLLRPRRVAKLLRSGLRTGGPGPDGVD